MAIGYAVNWGTAEGGQKQDALKQVRRQFNVVVVVGTYPTVVALVSRRAKR